MIFKEKFKILIKDIGKENYAKNIGLLEILENVATHQSDMIGSGPNSIEDVGFTWILLDWKIQVLKRPKYGETLTATTWGRTVDGEIKKAYTYRDFEVFDEQNDLCIIGTSKWVIMDIHTNRILKIDRSIIDKYEVEDKNVFNVPELDKIKEPDHFENELVYTVLRKDIDLNGHVHNLNYLSLAYEVLPEDVYEQRPFDNFRIQYKREIKLGDVIRCRYSFEDGEHIVTLCSEDGSRVNAIIKLK